MGNLIHAGGDDGAGAGAVAPVNMNNGLTSVVIGLMAMALTAEAETDTQRRLAVAVAARDQNLLGLGVVGFDVADLPWDESTFEIDQAFFLRSCDRAILGDDWHRLSYEPRREWVTQAVSGLVDLIESLTPDQLRPQTDWPLMPDVVGEVCDTHQALMHTEGCVLCNDG